MNKSYKLRIYPNSGQRELMSKTFGCVRYVYNYYLNKRIEVYNETGKSYKYYDCCKDLTLLKRELNWLCEVDNSALQNSLKNLNAAFEKFFNEHQGYPKFKSKKEHRLSFKSECIYNNIRVEGKKIRLPKIGFVKFRDKRSPQGRILNASVMQEPNGNYYVIVCCTDLDIPSLPKTNRSVGVDLGLRKFAVTSDGEVFDNPAFYENHLTRIARLHRELDRKTRGSSNRNRARIRLAKEYARVSNKRYDFTQKLSSYIVNNYDNICIEDLDIESMKEYGLARRILDASWQEFVRELKYKSSWYGKRVITVDRYFPSSQICHCCGERFRITKNGHITHWVCPNCRAEHDRDFNAAINILVEGLKQVS